MSTQEVNAETLCRAAVRIRKDQDIEENLGHIDPATFDTWLAIADWLEESAEHLQLGDDEDAEHVCPTALEGLDCSVLGQALTVARTYLGEPA